MYLHRPVQLGQAHSCRPVLLCFYKVSSYCLRSRESNILPTSHRIPQLGPSQLFLIVKGLKMPCSLHFVWHKCVKLCWCITSCILLLIQARAHFCLDFHINCAWNAWAILKQLALEKNKPEHLFRNTESLLCVKSYNRLLKDSYTPDEPLSLITTFHNCKEAQVMCLSCGT